MEAVTAIQAMLQAGRWDAESLGGRKFNPRAWDAADSALDALLAYIKQLERQNSLGSAPGEGSPYASVENRLTYRMYSEAVERATARAEAAEARVEQLEGERDSLMADSWRAYVEAGADPDGDLMWHCPPVMAGVSLIDAVKQLRADYDEALARTEERR